MSEGVADIDVAFGSHDLVLQGQVVVGLGKGHCLVDIRRDAFTFRFVHHPGAVEIGLGGREREPPINTKSATSNGAIFCFIENFPPLVM